jgi:hypothetical protein
MVKGSQGVTGWGGVAVAGRVGAVLAGPVCRGAGLTGMYSGPVWPQPASMTASAIAEEPGKWNGKFTIRITGE